MAAAAVGLANTRPPWSARGRVLLSRTAAVVCNFAVGNPNRLPTPSSRRLFLARASEPQKEGEEASTTNEYDIASAFTSQS
ncbi:uncharacterized protein LOC131158141 isoform X2 [Malania oleifera]|uniref:uncharacterized protein LOC131158141 isoform X2 n=1 Tax=Malania oleifera TaxID=397392 RepID=UPI0025ADE24F|nr:uncharacterized protein LOC131158141 isoform X2 [Malania oleifera]